MTGDLVLLSSRNLSFKGIPAKLQKSFVGPFEVIDRIGNQAYRLSLPESWKIQNLFHVSLLKRWKTIACQTEAKDSITKFDIDAEPRFEVEKILRWRKKVGSDRKKEYLVLWAGYPLEEATWEPEENFSDAAALKKSLEEDKPPEEKVVERGRPT